MPKKIPEFILNCLGTFFRHNLKKKTKIKQSSSKNSSPGVTDFNGLLTLTEELQTLFLLCLTVHTHFF